MNYHLPNTCGNCDNFSTCHNPHKDVNMLCSDATKMWNNDMKELQEYRATGLSPKNVIGIKKQMAKLHVKLRAYEEIGTIKDFEKAMETYGPKKVIRESQGVNAVGGWSLWSCPRCKSPLGVVNHPSLDNFCRDCGCELDWGSLKKGAKR